jgi:glycoprotein-N-acetylgalactosamine 3-beta-galactosyltransferase
MIMAGPVEALHLRSSRGRGEEMQGLVVDVDENSSHLQRKKLASYYSTLVSRGRQSLPSSFRLKLIVLAAVVMTILTTPTLIHLGKIELAVTSTSKSGSIISGGTTYLRHEDHIHTTNEAADVQNVTSNTVSESDICTKKVRKQRNQQHKVVLDRIEILPNDSNALNTKVLCFIPIISTDHNATAMDVMHTWGKRCDKLVFASNATDSDIGAIKVDIPTEDWAHLWQKQRETMRHIWQEYGKEYDWFLKADLDTYVIMENLKAYLASEEIQSKKDQPLILGRRVSRREEKWYQGFDHNKTLVDEFLKTSHNKFHYTMGGAGYVMNQKYMETFYESMDEQFCLSSEQEMTFPEDVGINFCMGNLGILPYNTRDELGRERFHLRSPEALFNVDGTDKSAWLYKVHRDVGGIQGGNDCCSPASITFHHVKGPGALYDFERMIYCK